MLLQKHEEQGLSKSNLANKRLYNVFVLCVVCGSGAGGFFVLFEYVFHSVFNTVCPGREHFLLRDPCFHSPSLIKNKTKFY